MKTVTLRDGRQVAIRALTSEDTQKSYDFFAALPPEDRKYLRVDVTRYDFVENRIHEAEAGRVLRLGVWDGESIVADGALELTGHGWGENIGEIRLIVDRAYQRLGLGLLLARELYFLAAQRRLDRIVARVMRPQKGAVHVLHRLGFHEEFLIPEQIRDQDGQWQDMIIMRCNLEDLWRELEGVLTDTDWGRHR